MSLHWRYHLAFLGGFCAMAAHMYLAYGRGGWFAPQRLSGAAGAGLLFGHCVALMVLFARDLPHIIFPGLPGWLRLLMAITGGTAFGILAWWSHLYLILFQTNPDWRVVLVGGFVLSAGFIATPYIPFWPAAIRAATAVVMTALSAFVPIYFSFQNLLRTYNSLNPAQALLYFQLDNPEHIWLVGVPFVLTVALIGQLPWVFLSPTSTSIVNSSYPSER